jgi:Protein of unknown function (DUF3575)
MIKHEMKRILIIISLFNCISIFAQKDFIKGRLIPLPLDYYTLGIGYERILKNNFSVQLLCNVYGFNSLRTDGGARQNISIIPECRYFFGEKMNENLPKSTFIGIFTEFLRTNYFNNYQDNNDRTETRYTNSINPGLLLGQSIKISKSSYIEFYVGKKLTFITSYNTKISNGTPNFYEEVKTSNGWRFGVNYVIKL